MRTLIIPDLHNEIDWVRPFIQQVEHEVLVFIGDYFDREKTPDQTAHTAIWLKELLLTYPSAIFLMGNHDMHYRFPQNPYLRCTGFSWEKAATINGILDKSDWQRFSLYTVQDGWFISHAGVSDVVFRPPGRALDLRWVKEACDRAMIHAQLGQRDDVLEPDGGRGGNRREGGIIWLDWDLLVPLPGINQIVGHSVDLEVRGKHTDANGEFVSYNYCIDTYCRYAGYLENGEFFMCPTPLVDRKMEEDSETGNASPSPG